VIEMGRRKIPGLKKEFGCKDYIAGRTGIKLKKE